MAERPERIGSEIVVPTENEILLRIGFPVLYVDGKMTDISEIGGDDTREHVIKMKATKSPRENDFFISGINSDGTLYMALVTDTDKGEVVKRGASPEEISAIAESMRINRFQNANVYALIQNYAGIMREAIKYRSLP